MLYSQERRKWVRKCLFKQCSLFEMSVSNKWSLFVSKSVQKTKTLTFCVVSCSTLSATSLHCHSNIPHCDSAAVSLNQRCVIFSSIKRQLMHSVRQVSYTISQSYHTFLIALILTQVFDKSCWSVQKKKEVSTRNISFAAFHRKNITMLEWNSSDSETFRTLISLLSLVRITTIFTIIYINFRHDEEKLM